MDSDEDVEFVIFDPAEYLKPLRKTNTRKLINKLKNKAEIKRNLNSVDRIQKNKEKLNR